MVIYWVVKVSDFVLQKIETLIKRMERIGADFLKWWQRW